MPYYSFCYNTTPNIDHNYSPFELVFARNANIFEVIPTKIEAIYNYDSYNKEMKYRLQVTHAQVLEAIRKTKQERTKNFNRNVQPSKVGDIVYLALENRTKLDNVNEGPYKVINTTLSNATIIDNQNKRMEVHKTRLIKFKK